MDKTNQLKFPGFPRKPTAGNWWTYPRILDDYSNTLTGSEQKVLDFILRHTWGFHKNSDEISYKQLRCGVGEFDKGTGLSKPTIIKSINGLIVKGFIEKLSGAKANRYGLKRNDFDSPSKESLPFDGKGLLHTINSNTINNKQYDFSSKKKPYFRGQEMRRDDRGKWWVIPKDGGRWLEFAGKESEIEWK